MSLQMLLRGASVAALSVVFSNVSPAQPASPPAAEWSTITVTRIKPEFRQEYEASSGANATDAAAFFGHETNALDRLSEEYARAIRDWETE